MDVTDISTITPLELISLEEPPATKEGAIEFLLDLAVDAGRVDDRDAALAALLEREEEATTGVGFGIGIPHAKTDAVSKPTVAFARSTEGIDFDAMDDKPAKLLFMILVPAAGGEDHLQILSALSRSLMHEDVREKLLEAESKQTVQDVLAEVVE
ncbi:MULTISPECIES: fructose PTS transporter subunit IIA [Haloferax]|uniref:Sugar phosphotransferase system IIA component n=3 Tax=Haloferax TaxID=2251 RepID=M0IAN3_HALVO|nr:MULTISPECIES: fructose PTS transporter subunit IIA [Haloferax]ELK54557.1 sugar phosphotransferase system IIA component [Haloferax sp. BAB-2207]ELZ74594.1 sugar phosphotransferase system IIA component [Haloferax lucentense DSM 14919]ELZ93870.1 sugar phosphotransferase system IIA component [Haloferax alexandrinus JCM 10717]MDS0239901.1 fructose PTS transporter subunit IIA [Haloferax sp. S2CR25]MDS0443022.1 fructose PTS transporter subunit IIA [Haloferax sp. S2CR25-2]